MTVELYLVRHGETTLNKAARLQGVTDAPLTAKGEAAADALGQLLRPIDFTHAYVSDRKRALDTAHRILTVQAHTVPLTESSGLREYYFGGFEGTKNIAMMRTAIRAYGFTTMRKALTGDEKLIALVNMFASLDPTGQAETWPALRARVRQTFAEIVAAEPGGRVLVVAHGMLLATMIALLAPEQLPTTLLKNTSVSVLTVTGQHWQVKGVNLTTAGELAQSLSGL